MMLFIQDLSKSCGMEVRQAEIEQRKEREKIAHGVV